MQKILLALVLVLSAQFSVAAIPSHIGDGQALPSLAPMLKQVNPAVVNIATFSTRKQAHNPLMNDPFFRHFFGDQGQAQPQDQRPQRRQQSAGSGVIVDAGDGVVMTNFHVIKDADEIQVSLIDGRTYEATLAGSDPELDIAILKIEAADLVHVSLADSDTLLVGDFVVAIGNPFGLGQTVTTGIVSALGRSGLGIEGYESFIQTDASINPGNSGGALVNLRGELVGINTAIISPAGGNVGIGFAIPINMAKASMEQILESGEVKRGVIGIGIQEITPDLQKAFELKNGQQGVLITGVFDDTPAKKAGFEPGDIIIAVNGEKTISAAKLRNQIGMRKIGETLTLDILRNNKTKRIKVTVGEPGKTLAGSGKGNPLFDGSMLEESEDGRGVIVVKLSPSSSLALAGLRQGDVIYSVNRTPVATIEDIKKLVKVDDEQVLLRIVRNGQSFFVVLK